MISANSSPGVNSAIGVTGVNSVNPAIGVTGVNPAIGVTGVNSANSAIGVTGVNPAIPSKKTHPLFSLSSHTALVTGSSRGIGRATALALGRAGARVFFHGASDSPALREAVGLAHAAGVAAEAHVADLGDASACDRLAAECAAADILVLNASVQSYGHITDFDDAEFDRMARTNLRSSFRLVRAFGPAMAARGWGRIVSIGSVNQGHPAPRLAIYAATKAAQKNLMLTAAKEWASQGVTVNTVTPGVIATDRNAKVLSDPSFADPLRESIPAKRFGVAEDCAGIVVALCSDACSYITGADIPVDGGFSL